MWRIHKKGQSTLEYAMLIAAVVAGLLMMQIYVKRGIGGRVKSASDDLGEQFDPVGFSSEYTTHTQVARQETVQNRITESKLIAKDGISGEEVMRQGSETVAAWADKENLQKNW